MPKKATPRALARKKVVFDPKDRTARAEERLSEVLPKPATDSKGRIYCVLKDEYRPPAPEETVRQGFILHLNQHYGYDFGQMGQELKTMHGRRSPRADIVIWESVDAKASGKTPVLVIECKAESVDIHPRDYYQGESYARAVGCEFFLAHNERQTHIFKLVPGTPGECVPINEIPKASDWGDARKIEEIKNNTRAFSRKEFQDLLFRCHCILRDVHKMEPGRAFDAISKILFIKMYVERTGSWGTFTTSFLDKRDETRLPTDPPVHVGLFEQTKANYKDDEIFSERDDLEVSEDTFRRIVKELERFNLSATGDDVKGLAFEQFLGTTFRGQLGQFFTPRPVVDFMVKLLDPLEGELICDPASGSGGFLIAAFEHVRNAIEADVQALKDAARAEIEAKNLPEDKEVVLIEKEFGRLNQALDPEEEGSRIRKLARDSIFGTDAEPRAARTSKMNMIMHGDGHGGIHFHDGLVDINGIFPGRFDVVLTNPEFGGNVGADQKFGASEQSRVHNDRSYVARCQKRYGEEWEEHHRRSLRAVAERMPILDAYEIGKDKPNRPTELIFIERCLRLLAPGGRMGIVLPDGNLNNPSLSWLRRWAEGKARLIAVVSLPEETFVSADATVKASLVFLRRFTEEDAAQWESCWADAHAKHDAGFDAERSRLCAEFGRRILCGDSPEVQAIVDGIAALGVKRELPEWKQGPLPPYPRGVGPTTVGKPKATGAPTDRQEFKRLRGMFDALWTDDLNNTAEQLYKQLKSALRKLDAAHNAALWKHVREAFDYPVFTAAPESVGITSTGDTGGHVPNQLPAVLAAYRRFEEWLAAGAPEGAIPDLNS
jgi:type I restriction enzyme M protein